MTDKKTFSDVPLCSTLEVFNAIEANIALINQNGITVAVNNGWRDFADANGLAKHYNYFLGANYFAACGDGKDENERRIADQLRSVVSGALDSYNYEYPCHSPENLRWFRMSVRQMRQAGEVFAVILHSDITDQKLSEFALRKESKILSLIDDAIFLTDFDNTILYVNRAVTDIYGWSQSELLHKNENDFFPVEAIAKETLTVKSCGSWSGELVQPTKKGELVTISARWIHIKTETGKDAILKVHTDLRFISELLRSQRMLTIGQMASGIAHEIGNALQPILLLAERIEADTESPHAPAAARIVALADRTGGFIKRILGFAKGVEGTKTRENLTTLIAEFANVLRINLSKGVEGEFDLDGLDEMYVLCNRAQIEQLILNLVTNANDSIHGAGVVSIQLSRHRFEGNKKFFGRSVTGDFACISVTDSGKGMSAKELENIFEPFFTTKPVGQGTGLGLSTCLAIAKYHNGFIEARSTIGKGSRIEFYIPLISD